MKTAQTYWNIVKIKKEYYLNIFRLKPIFLLEGLLQKVAYKNNGY